MLVQLKSFGLVPRSLIFAAMALGGIAGCDSGPPTAPVHGKVSVNGSPVTTGSVKFYPVEGGRPAVSGIRSDGTYELARKVPGDEVLLGEYVVTIEATKVTGGAPQPKSLAEEMAQVPSASPKATVKYLVPRKYGSKETSGLTATVEDKDNVIDFNLE